jgi:hypothetical protein
LELVGGGVDYLLDVVAEVFYWMVLNTIAITHQETIWAVMNLNANDIAALGFEILSSLCWDAAFCEHHYATLVSVEVTPERRLVAFNS